MNRIKERFDAAPKLFGATDEIITASGTKVRGRYVLCESGVVTPSHDPLNGFSKSIGFPTDENGQTVNDRDYERDTDAQRITRQIAQEYDNRALQSPVVVSQGIVLSGNGRTMAGMLAAMQGTDGSYISYLKSHLSKYGFADGDADAFEHPRCVFVTDEVYDMNAKVFAMFNAQETKRQSKTEQAVKFGKTVDDEAFRRLIRSINTFDTISDFYADTKASVEAFRDLVKMGVISENELPAMIDGDTISQEGRDRLENVLIGKAFAQSPDSVRQITAFKGVRRNIITALAEISNNISLGEYSLENELSQAIALCYQARANGCFRQGDVVSGFARQMTMFGDTETLADFRNSTVMMLADIVNHSQVTKLKKLFALYNHQASDAAGGQTDMFSSGEVKSKAEILADVNALFGTKKELDEALADATDNRKQAAEDDIWMERAKQMTEFSGVYDEVTTSGIWVGSFAGLQLPCGEVIVVKLELLSNGIAGIRLRGFKRIKVSEELLVPTNLTHCTLPEWLPVDVPKDSILDVLLSYKKVA
jgi:hypothetical protein